LAIVGSLWGIVWVVLGEFFFFGIKGYIKNEMTESRLWARLFGCSLYRLAATNG